MERTYDELAKALIIDSGKQFNRMKAMVKKADELRPLGKAEDYALFLSVLNRSPSAAYDLLQVDLESLSYDDKNNIKYGKTAPRVFLQEARENKERQKTSYGSAMSRVKSIEALAKELRGDMLYLKDNKQKQKVLERIEGLVQGLKRLDAGLMGQEGEEDEG